MKSSSLKIQTLIISVAIHLALLGLLIWGAQSTSEFLSQNALWQGGNVAMMSLNLKAQNDEGDLNDSSDADSASQNPLSPDSIQSSPAPKKATHSTSPNNSANTRSAQGDGLDQTGALSPNTLALIRKKIAKSKVIPLDAEAEPLAGSVKVVFQINPNGNIESLQVLTSSGSPIVDKAALQSIKRAEPLPYYKNPIALELEYQ